MAATNSLVGKNNKESHMSESDTQQKPDEVVTTRSEEPKASPVTPPTKPQTASIKQGTAEPRRSVSGIGWLALLVSLGSAGAVGYLWVSQERTAAQWQGNTAGLSAELKSINDRAQLEADRAAEMKQQMQSMAQQFDTLDRNVQQVMAVTGDPGRYWMLVEAEFLLRNAGYRLQLERDVTSSIAALQDADRQLEHHSDPALQPLRETIAQQIAALQALSMPDVAGLSANLTAMLNELDKLPMPSPLKGVGKVAEGASAGESEPLWKATVLKLWEQLKALVVVRHGEKAEAPLMPPDQNYFLYMNLRLKLESARLALLQGNEQVWHDSLSQASKWLQTYFEVKSPAVQAAQQNLARLGQTTIRPPLPDVSAALQLLREYMSRHPAPQAQILAPVPVQPAPAPAAPATQPEGPSL